VIIVLLRWTLCPTAISRILPTSNIYGFAICFDCLLAPFCYKSLSFLLSTTTAR
jgi:hypothetical protein